MRLKKTAGPPVIATASSVRSRIPAVQEKSLAAGAGAMGRSNEEEPREKFYTARLHETRAKGHTFLHAFGSKWCGVARCRPKYSPNLSRRKLPRWSALCQAGCMVGNLCIRWRRCRDKSRCSLCLLLNPRGVQSVRPSVRLP